jgi:hypothetical protein
MPPATGPALIILVAFVLPGFVTVLIQENTYRYSEDPTTLDRLLRILYYSVWTYLLLAVAALILGENRQTIERLYEQNKGTPAELVWRGALVVLIPSILIATVTRFWYGSSAQKWVLERLRINRNHLQPTGWDYFFRQGREAQVRVTFKDGGRVYGYYGGKSFSAYAKDGRDLFLERLYGEDGDWFGPLAGNNCGVWINTQDAVCIEFYSPKGGATDAETANTPASPDTPSGPSAGGTGTPAATGSGDTPPPPPPPHKKD